MSQAVNDNLLKFSLLISSVDPSLWHRLTQLKLDVDKLCENVHQLWGYYSNRAPQGLNNILTVDCTSFNEQPDECHNVAVGTVINRNTIEGFKEQDKAKILGDEGKKLMEIIKNDGIEKPTLLTRFLMFCFADLKKYHYYYWFAFPAPSFLSCHVVDKPKSVSNVLNKDQLNSLCDNYLGISDVHKRNFFILNLANDSIKLYTVKEGLENTDCSKDWMFAFADSSGEASNPGWMLRNYLALLSYHCKKIVADSIQVLCLRLHLSQGVWSVSNSIVIRIQVNLDQDAWEKADDGSGWVGWERNERGRMGPRFANLSSSMDPVRLADTSVDLNLKLMKWQLLPELELDLVKYSKCLLLGAGTLGCVVARNLMAWGVRHITFVDYGKVSYSNPVRQFLYKFSDCGGHKAEVAASSLKEIFPGIVSEGIVMSIPMPGHPVGESLLEETQKNVMRLSQLIDEHDVTFLLMDSRESRWLPTMMGAAKGKLVINAALGFDSYLVMRHGVKDFSGSSSSSADRSLIPGSQLGCYFCNDVTAPGNSARSRTLDQQCTVTRPGVSSIAGALAVELLVSILQHPLQGLAPAETDQECDKTMSCLGIVPHSVRGFISEYRTILPATEAFACCVACSSHVVNEYKAQQFHFILKALQSKEYLEELSGLSRLHDEPIMAELLEYSDSDSDAL